MAFEHNDNCGSLFRNDRKDTPSKPDHNGDCKVICPHCKKPILYWIASWVNEMKNKPGKYFNIRFNAKDENFVGNVRPQVPDEGPELDDDIPF